FYQVGYLTQVVIMTVGVSLLSGLIGWRMGEPESVLAPANDANAQPTVAIVMQKHPPPDLARLRAHQANPKVHPFTCGSGRRTDQYHLDGEGILVPTATGWTCPYCDYRQPYGEL